MAFATMGGDSGDEQNAEINMVPFIDVMLVLLVIFIVAAPLLTHTVRLQLPRASSSVDSAPTPPVRVSIDAEGRIFWGREAVSPADLETRIAEEARRDPVPELQIRADQQTDYEHLARVMSVAARNGLGRIGFVTEPEPAR